MKKALKNNLGVVFVSVACALPALFWIFQEPINYRFGNLVETSTSFGQLTGLVGMSMFAVVLFLSARLKIFDKYFDGLGRAYNLHHMLGGLAFILLLFHPLMLAIRYIPSSIQIAFGFIFSFNDAAINYGKIALLGMIVLLVITFYVRSVMKYQTWKLSHKLLGAFFFIGGLHMLFIPSDVSVNFPLRWYMILISTIGIVAYFYRTILYPLSIRRFTYEIKDMRMAGEGVTEITFSPIGRKIEYEPGQFIFVSFKNSSVGPEPHPFSLISNPEENSIQIAAKIAGDFTSKLPGLKIGDKAKIEGPFGKFNYKNAKSKQQIWIAGGIGITPFLSMARSINWPEYKIDLYYSFRNATDGAYLDELKDISFENPNFSFLPWTSGKVGQLNVSNIRALSSGLEGKSIFVCGPVAMMQAIEKGLKDEKIPSECIHTEEFSM
jgi:predicted ferric reductase